MEATSMELDSEDLEDLGVKNLGKKVWLVKLPKFVHQHWAEREPGDKLGHLRIYNKQIRDHTGGMTQKVTLTLPENDSQTPRNYNLTITNLHPVNEYIFTESDQGRAMEIAGSVQHEATIGPIVDDDYRRIMKERTKAAFDVSNSRKSQMMSDKASKQKGMIATQGNQWDKVKVFVDKKERLPREVVLDQIFAAFKEKAHLSLKELIEKTQQPSSWLKEILAEVCLLNKRGPFNGQWNLKDEYVQMDEVKQEVPSNQ